MTILMGERRPDFNWEGMMKWWSAPSDGSHSPPVSEEENFRHRENCDDKTDVGFYDVDQRVHLIGINLIDDGPDGAEDVVGFPYSVDTVVDLLVELQELAEYVDITEELHSGNCLAPLFQKVLCYTYAAGIYNKHAVVRTKAAEVVTTMVHNNPTNQQLVMEANGLQHLLDNFISDPDLTARTKALVAISSLIRNNKPAITKFLLDNGYAALRNALISESVTLQREALNLIQYLLHENSSDCNIVTQLGIHHMMMHLTSSDDAQVREAALRGLLVLATNDGGQALLILTIDKDSGQLVRNHDQLKNFLQVRINRVRAMPLEDLSAAREEIQLVDSLWNTFYNEPSSLRDLLPGVTQ